MKCKNKEINLIGMEYNDKTGCVYMNKELSVIITNDEIGKTLSIDNGEIQFTVPAEEIAKLLN